MVTSTEAYGQTVGLGLIGHTSQTDDDLVNPGSGVTALVTAGANGCRVTQVTFQTCYDIFTDTGSPSPGVWRLFIGTSTSAASLFDEVAYPAPDASENLATTVEYNEVRMYEHLYLESGEILYATSSEPPLGEQLSNYFASYTNF